LSIDLELDDAQAAIRDAVGRFCEEHCPEERVRAGSLSHDLWRELAGLGVLALATPDGDGGAREAVAALEALGAAVFPGPLAATFFASQLLPPEDRRAVTSGDCLVSVGTPPLMPFAPLAGIFLAVSGERVVRGEPRAAVESVGTLGGEPWGRVELDRGEAIEPPLRAYTLHDTALAAYTAAAGRRLVEAAAEHARTRVQFGRPIGDFQAVAHPLADAAMRLDAARTLARAAACAFDDDPDAQTARAAAGAARLSARGAALEAAHVAHQVFGALGITLEGPAFLVSRRIRQLASQPPADTTSREAVLAPYLGESA
jgi:alkylation response protein AidB-like acyl-CoA dehydrogenase